MIPIKQRILEKAFNDGKTIQAKSTGQWLDFDSNNQVDKPNWSYGSIDNWRIEPDNKTYTSEEVLELLIETWEESQSQYYDNYYYNGEDEELFTDFEEKDPVEFINSKLK